ncbi:MAG TPA: 4-(cytidine 5'-diphospho)-2-C-methyl-D-erythritol kinase [Hyphomicrobiales bacterium]|nr:4-(cytidine 5'-diphospho)-2-C-methyl-D-erythritol kinase [Hyphomicrobiales bacterium]
MTVTLPAPAKLNLFLHVTGRRVDGYHTLETAFQLLDYGDLLDFRWENGEGFSLACDLPGLNTDDNLITRAAALLAPHRRLARKVHVTLHKRLPLGGGVGGGSSDAATTLLALNALWGCGFTSPQLARLGLALGADVPVFVAGYSAFARGVGEELEPLVLPTRWYLVLTPPCHSETRTIFGHPELTRQSAPLKIRGFPFSGTRNDCEPVACRLYPAIGEALAWLGHHAPARMTGTGASVFAAFASKPEAQAVQAQLPPSWRSFVAQGVNQSAVPALAAALPT